MRAIDLAGNTGAAATRTVTVAAAPVVTFLSGPDGRRDPVSGAFDGASGTENAVFTFSVRPAGLDVRVLVRRRPTSCRAARAIRATGAAWVVENGEHEFAVRATNAQGIVGEESVYEWLVELAPDIAEPELDDHVRAGQRHAAPGGHLHLHRHRQPDAGGRPHASSARSTRRRPGTPARRRSSSPT